MEEKDSCYHVPVMLRESLEGLDIRPDGIYVDVTFGGGGHSREILKRLGSGGELYGFDQDADAEHNIPADPRFTFVRSNFRYLYNFMRYYGESGEVDGLLADLGVSSHHFDDKDRGFSFRFDGTLDVRMNTRAGQTAADIVNNYTAEALAASKHFQLGRGTLGVHLSYLYNRREDYPLNGVAGGITYNPSFAPHLNVIAEYDSKDFAMGATYLLFNHIHFQFELQRMKYFSGGLCYKIYLR